MNAENLNQKPQRVIAIQSGTHYYTEATTRTTLASGLYNMSAVRVGNEIVPGFVPVAVTNDEPLDIDPLVHEIVKEFEDFFNRRPIFKKMGFAHKRGYLLHGPPGCGKSSTLRLLQKKFLDQFQGIVLFWRHGASIENYVDFIRENESDRPLMVICEDIDQFMEHFETKILEFLDGQKGLDNFLLVATTNNLKQVPSRIKDRPSRIDRVLEIGKPSRETRLKYLLALNTPEAEANTIADRTEGFSIAHLKEVVVATVCLGQSLESVFARLKKADMGPSDGSGDDGDYDEDGDPMEELMGR